MPDREAIPAAADDPRADHRARLIAASTPAGTSRTYRGRVRDWRRWCESAGLDHVEALTDKHVADYIADRHAAGMAARTLKTAVSALRHWCKQHGRPEPVGFEVRNMIKGAVRLDAKNRQRQPRRPSLRRGDVQTAIDAIDTEDGGPIEHRDRAILAVAADAMLRISELRALDCEDVTAADDGGGLVLIRRSKTDQDGRGAVVYIPPATLDLVRAWTAAAGIESGPLWRGVSRHGHAGDGRIAERYLQRIIRERCAAVGHAGITCHALRRGMAETLIARGTPTVEVMQAGRWRRAEMAKLYGRGIAAEDGAVARLHREARK